MREVVSLPLSMLELCAEVSMQGKWFRVVDPLSPLYGCDVRGRSWTSEGGGYIGYLIVEGMRRVDLFVGDRPFQLIARDGEDLGLTIRETQLEESPIQDDVMEAAYDRPHGICIDESEMSRGDGVVLRIARYERATQIALEDPRDDLLVTNTFTKTAADGADDDIRSVMEEMIVKMFERGDDPDDIAYALENN